MPTFLSDLSALTPLQPDNGKTKSLTYLIWSWKMNKLKFRSGLAFAPTNNCANGVKTATTIQ